MIDVIIEVFVNLFQAFIFIGFLYLFFDKSKSKAVNIISMCSAALILFSALCFFNFYTGYISFMDVIIYISIIEIYAIIFLKGNIWTRVIMPIITYVINTVISFSFGYIVSFVTGKAFSNLISESSVYRYFCMAIINLTNLLVFWLIVKLAKKKINFMKWTDVSAFIIIPIIALTINILYIFYNKQN